jgi:hypothetical protein
VRTLALLLLTAGVGLAAPPRLKLPDGVAGEVADFVTVTAETDGRAVRFVPLDPGLKVFPSALLADPKSTVVTAAVPGRYRLLAYTGNADGPSDPATVTVTIGTPAPAPPGPVPPGPTPPGPQPPPPAPGVDPIGLGGFAVLIVFDQANTTRPPGELSVIYGRAVQDYLESKCAPDPASRGWKAFRIYPDNTDVGRAPKAWADAFGKRGGKDWILIGTGAGGYSGPLPKSEGEALALLKKYGG